ncbi:2927_t:CDS:2 [Dentiscutata heterogama]|uniref:2927_t:CDS:1 n=1 Tax=Dentiscutata heterogama TaxID=1316150 RepID=A0ACA9MBM8_9GLOM|nr:2927_t:CDS:2 [Dentiscutata heterogama]
MTTKKFSDFLEESPILNPQQTRRKILLPYKPNSSSSLELYQWASTNYFQSSLDHVYFVSVINIPRIRYPAPDNVWSFGYQSNVSTNFDYEKNLQRIKNEENAVKNGLEDIVNELRSKNITSSLIIKKGNTHKELLSACKSIKPDVILMSHSNNDHQRRKLTKLFKLFDRSIVNLMKKKFPNIPIVINDDDDNQDNSKSCSCSKFCSSNTEKGERIHKCKIYDNRTSKKGFHRVFKKVKRQMSLKSSMEDSKHYHQLSEG